MRHEMFRRRARLIVVVVGLLSCAALAPRTASAAERPVAEQAEAHIQKGVELRRANRDTEALAEFQKAVALAPSARARAQLGLAEMAVGHFEVAEKWLREVLAASGSDAWVDAHQGTLADALDKTLAQLGTLNVSGEPQGAHVQINGRDLCSLPCSVHVQAGDVAVRVLAAGFLPILRTVSVTARQVSNQEFTLVKTSESDVSEARDQAVAVKPTPRESETTLSDSGKKAPEQAQARSPWPWIAASAGVLVGGFGTFEAVQWSRKASDFNNKKDASGNLLCGDSDPAAGGSGCDDLRHEAQNARLLAIGGLTIGVGLGVLSWVLFSRDAALDPAPSQSSMRELISCSPTLGLNSIVCSARF